MPDITLPLSSETGKLRGSPMKATNEQIIEAYKVTGSIWAAAKRLGLCGQSVHERLKRLNYPVTVRGWTKEELSEASILAINGFPISRIAERLGRTYAATASQLSLAGVKHGYRPARKPKRKEGWTKITANKAIDEALNTGIPITRIAKKYSHATTALVNAVQFYAPLKWRAYVDQNGIAELHTCPGCNGQFIRITRKQKYCSGKCGMAYRADKRYFGGNRMNTIGLASSTCQLCMKVVTKGLSSHHIIGKQRDPENQYLIALCSGCHNLVETAAARKGAMDSEFWENLIILAMMRAGACETNQAFGLCVSVEVEHMDATEEEEAVGTNAAGTDCLRELK